MGGNQARFVDLDIFHKIDEISLRDEHSTEMYLNGPSTEGTEAHDERSRFYQYAGSWGRNRTADLGLMSPSL